MGIENKNRIVSFDLLKIVSIFAVFMHHILMDVYVVHPMYNLKWLSDIMIRPNTNFAMLACCAFIMISGATLTINKRDESLISFYKRRITKLLVPFYFAYMCALVIRIVNARSFNIFNDIPVLRFIFTILGMDEYLSANGIRTFTLGVGEWFLGCIILCYLCYPLLYYFHKKNKWVTFIVMTIYFVIINYIYYKLPFIIPSYMNFICQIYNFYLGIFIIDNEILDKLNKKVLVFTIPIILIFFMSKVSFTMPDNFKASIVVISLLFSFFVFESGIMKSKLLINFCKFFNRISLEFFLVHHFIIYQVNFLLAYKKLRGYEMLIVIIFDLWMTIILSFIINYLSRKVKSSMNYS